MIGVYALAGLFLVLKGWYQLSDVQNYGMGFLLIAYGCFRFYRENQYRRLENQQNQPEEEPQT